MGKKILLLLAVAIVAMVMIPAVASAGLVNEYGMHYAGQQKCVDCHAFFGGTTTNTVHSRFVKEGLVPAPPEAWTQFAAAGTPPVVAGTPPALFNSGGTYDIDQPWLTFGDFAAGDATEYAFWRGSSDPNVVPWNLVEGLVAEPAEGAALPIDEGEYLVGVEDPDRGLYDVQYGCQRCHMLGSTVPTTAAGQEVPGRPGAATATTPRQWARDDTMSVADFMADPSVSIAGIGIQCENCHGTGVAATPAEGAHTNTGVKVSTTLATLGQAQVCGQCHGSYTTVPGTLGIYGFTTDQPMRNFVDINGLSGGVSYTYKPTEEEFLAAPTKYFLFPNGDNAKGGHYYYNEWSTTAHSYRPALANDSPDATVFQNNYTGHFGPASGRASGCWKCHTGEGYLKSKNAKIAKNFTPAPDNVGFMGQECVTCHNGHPSKLPGDRTALRTPDLAGERSAVGLPDNQSICEDCHNWQMEVLGTTPNYRPLADIGGHVVSHPQRETRHNRDAMVDVDMENAEQFMPGAKCQGCHVVKTNRGANRFAHGMQIMMPEKAELWNEAASAAGTTEYVGQDSCSNCHPGETREQLQDDIDKWQGGTAALAVAAEEAITAVTSTKPAEFFAAANASDPDYILTGRATWNFKVWEADASNGVHNPEYIQAGLEKAVQLADSAGGSFKSLFWSNSVVPGGAGFVSGKVVDGNDTGDEGAAYAELALYKNNAPTTMETTADKMGNFAFMITPGGSAVYNVVWMRSGDARTHLSSANMSVAVAKMPSKTTLAASASSILVNKSVKLSGKVTPSAAGQTVQIQYRRTTTASWKALGQPVALNSTSQYAKVKTLTSKGTWYFRTRYVGTATVASSTSATVKVIVK